MTERKRVYSGSPYEGAFGFCRAIKCGDLVAVAGTAPIPPPGEEVAETAYEQMQRCIEIVSSALAELDADLSDLTRTRMYLSSADYAEEVGRAHAEAFAGAPPVATMVVASLLDPRWKVEIEVEGRLERP